MKRTFKKVFCKDREKLHDALKMYASGKTTMYIARKFGVHHSTIIFWRKKHNIKKGDMETFDNYMAKIKPAERIPHKYHDLLFEETREGRQYKDYFE